MFAVQTEIAEQVIGQFEMLTGPVRAPDVTAAKRKRLESLTAYELTLLGVEKTLEPDPGEHCRVHHDPERAIEVDPNYARAWVNLAWAYSSTSGYGADWSEASRAALSAARRAVELDLNDAGAHSALGHVLGQRGVRASETEFETSLRLSPSSFSILIYYVG